MMGDSVGASESLWNHCQQQLVALFDPETQLWTYHVNLQRTLCSLWNVLPKNSVERLT